VAAVSTHSLALRASISSPKSNAILHPHSTEVIA
jgi:hypothetical protein